MPFSRSAAWVERRAGSDEANIIVNELLPLEDLQRRGTKGIVIRIKEDAHGASALEQLRELAAEFSGDAELRLLLQLTDGQRLELKSDSLRVNVTPEFRERIDQILGPGNVRVLTAAPRQSQPAPRPAYPARTPAAANA